MIQIRKDFDKNITDSGGFLVAEYSEYRIEAGDVVFCHYDEDDLHSYDLITTVVGNVEGDTEKVVVRGGGSVPIRSLQKLHLREFKPLHLHVSVDEIVVHTETRSISIS